MQVSSKGVNFVNRERHAHVKRLAGNTVASHDCMYGDLVSASYEFVPQQEEHLKMIEVLFLRTHSVPLTKTALPAESS